MIIMYLLMVTIVLTINSMENNTNKNTVFAYTLPFWNGIKEEPFNAVEEIEQLACQGTGELSYRESKEPHKDGEDKELGHLSKGKNEENNNASVIASNLPFGTIAFKSSINCGIGYLSLTNTILDSYFRYYQQFDQSANKIRKVYQINNLVNIYYIINMLQKVTATCIEKGVNDLHQEYINTLLSKKGVDIDNYTNKAEVFIGPEETVHLITCMKNIDSLIMYQNYHGLAAYSPLKANAAEYFLQLLLYVYILWRQDEITHIIPLLSDKMVLFLEAAPLKNELDNYQLMRKACDIFIAQIQEAYVNKDFDQKCQKKHLAINTFLKALNKYVYNLTVVPVLSAKNNRDLENMHKVSKRKKAVTESDSFFIKNKKSATNIALTILTITLLYRLIKKNSKNMKTYF